MESQLTGIAQQFFPKTFRSGSQASLVYVNTHMVQSILSEPEWVSRLSERDLQGLSPLFYLHINPYGRFDIDLDKRIDFGKLAA
ncbi:Tn3 family transposase [Hoeflea sp.]|uniref:Tn3 family transposase n=1 Tax=Hoeflea sp. TaxID=1940281 RepID=UPI003B026BDB